MKGKLSKEDNSWDGKSKASSVGILIFVKLIQWFGLLPAYSLLIFVAIHYTIFQGIAGKSIRLFRQKLNLPTYFWHIYLHNFSLGLNMIDRFAQLVKKHSPFSFECIGEDYFSNALNKNMGLVLLSAHVGNQEIAGDILFEHINTQVNYLMLDNEKEKIKNIYKDKADQRSVKIIPTNSDFLDMMLKVKNALNNNEIVCMLGDRVMGREKCESIPFLGKEARFPTYPFEVAALTGSPIITAVTVKTGVKKYQQKVYNFLPFDNIPRSQRKQYIRKSMEKYVDILEDMARDNPYSWFNFYDFWKEMKC